MAFQPSQSNLEIQAKRLEAELQKLSTLSPGIDTKLLTSPIGNVLQITIYPSRIRDIRPSLSEDFQPVDVLLFLRDSFPFHPPRVVFRSNFTYPSLADGRDFASDVLGDRPWSA
jgi:ubiquitin-protein ligase